MRLHFGVRSSAEASWWTLHHQLAEAEENHLRVPCRSMDPGPWDGESADQIEFAVRQCRRCPVLDACGQFAAANHEPAGVWAGVLHDRRPGRPPQLTFDEEPLLFDVQPPLAKEA